MDFFVDGIIFLLISNMAKNENLLYVVVLYVCVISGGHKLAELEL